MTTFKFWTDELDTYFLQWFYELFSSKASRELVQQPSTQCAFKWSRQTTSKVPFGKIDFDFNQSNFIMEFFDKFFPSLTSSLDFNISHFNISSRFVPSSRFLKHKLPRISSEFRPRERHAGAQVVSLCIIDDARSGACEQTHITDPCWLPGIAFDEQLKS